MQQVSQISSLGGRFDLLGLPQELRDMIYAEYMRDRSIIYSFGCTKNEDSGRIRTRAWIVPTDLAMSCKQVKQKLNTFCASERHNFAFNIRIRSPKLIASQSIIRQLPMYRIKQLTISMHLGEPKHIHRWRTEGHVNMTQVVHILNAVPKLDSFVLVLTGVLNDATTRWNIAKDIYHRLLHWNGRRYFRATRDGTSDEFEGLSVLRVRFGTVIFNRDFGGARDAATMARTR